LFGRCVLEQEDVLVGVEGGEHEQSGGQPDRDDLSFGGDAAY
jgi:hypothetical protein